MEKQMPYIPDTQRTDIHTDLLDRGVDFVPENAGELNYIASELINNYLQQRGMSYAAINEMIGALECCKLELYRMIAVPYEELKMRENGAVYAEVNNV
jgi:hypothetical protein